MNKIQKMVHDLCPNGVEWKTLGEVAELKAGKSISASQIFESQSTQHKFPCFGGNGIRGYVDSFSHHGEYPIIGRQGALCGCVNYAKGEFYATEHAVVAKPKGEVLSRYLFYVLQNADLNQYKTQGAQPGLSVTKLNGIVFPIPPLPVQVEIVNLLDKFTQLSADLQAELKKELQLRRKQYDYYRNHLLSFDSNSTTVQWMPLGECCIFQRGTTITAKDAVEGKVPVVAGGLKPAYYHNVANRTGETITVAGSGAYAGYVSYWDIPIYVSDAFSISPKDETFTVKYLYYFLKNNQEKIHKTKKGSGVPHVHPSSIQDFSIPIPSLAEQERIVGILDKFETLVNDLSKGLPAEIALVQKQYEYYRNLLLTFE